MYGALIVLEPGSKFDPESDHIVLLGGNGPETTALEMNRSTNPPPMLLKAGIKHRFRIINISTNFIPTVTLRGSSGLAQWRAVAKDGADLPPNQATLRPASIRISIGETYDYEFDAAAPGDYRLEVLRGGFLTSALVRVVR
jgi:FtsP/CotA-like multicopper oxidase with cupredoxin domain